MRLILAIGLLLATSTAALAAPDDTVRTVLAAASHNWESEIAEVDDYFSEERLDTLYSKAFAKSFRDAWKLATDNDDGIFEMDFIVNAQAACKFEDIKLEDKAAAGGVTLVDSRFNAFRCLTNGEDTTRVSHLVFRIISQDGHDVIDDIERIDGTEQKSIRQEMDKYAKAMMESAQ